MVFSEVSRIEKRYSIDWWNSNSESLSRDQIGSVTKFDAGGSENFPHPGKATTGVATAV